MVTEKQNEAVFRENSQFYKIQSEELEKVNTDLTFELRAKNDSENFLKVCFRSRTLLTCQKHQLDSLKSHCVDREEHFKAEARSLRRVNFRAGEV